MAKKMGEEVADCVCTRVQVKRPGSHLCLHCPDGEACKRFNDLVHQVRNGTMAISGQVKSIRAQVSAFEMPEKTFEWCREILRELQMIEEHLDSFESEFPSDGDEKGDL